MNTPNKLLAPAIVLQNVAKLYPTASGDYSALREINLSINSGEFIALIGKSGSGKSTLLNMIAGIDRPSSGKVMVAGQALQGLNEEQISQWRGRNIGIVFQFFQLLPTLTAVENVMLAMDFCQKFSARERRPRALELLGQVGVPEQAHKLPSALSGGQQQRVAIARALANAPAAIVADEPTGNLDSATSNTILQLFRGLASAGTTVVIATHDKEIAALSDRTLQMLDGRLLEATRSAPIGFERVHAA